MKLNWKMGDLAMVVMVLLLSFVGCANFEAPEFPDNGEGEANNAPNNANNVPNNANNAPNNANNAPNNANNAPNNAPNNNEACGEGCADGDVCDDGQCVCDPGQHQTDDLNCGCDGPCEGGVACVSGECACDPQEHQSDHEDCACQGPCEEEGAELCVEGRCVCDPEQHRADDQNCGCDGPCEEGRACDQGVCRWPCESQGCGAPPARCEGNTLVEASAGICDLETGQCDYSDVELRTDCTAVQRGCRGDVCVDLCAQVICGDRPEDFCDGPVAISFSGGGGVCDFETGLCDPPLVESRTNCAQLEQGCLRGACVPLCGEVVCDQPNAELCVDGVCVCDPELHQNDADNCGCDGPCEQPNVEDCVAGQCVCDPDLHQADDDNCGCNGACEDDEVCDGGSCVCNPDNDNNADNCGCNGPCEQPNAEACVAGQCVCDPDLHQADADNCACNGPCDQPNAEVCVDGGCVCDPELHQSDDDNCGCSGPCDLPNAEACVAGQCVCDPDLHQSDDDNCGCDGACAEGETCNSGACQPLPGTCALPLELLVNSSTDGSVAGLPNIDSGDACEDFGAEAVLQFVADADGIVCVNTVFDINRAEDPSLFVQAACGDPDTEIACNNDIGGGGDDQFQAQVEFTATDGVTYFIVVSANAADNGGDFSVALSRGACN